MIQEQLAFLPEFLPDYRPFPPAKERTAWQGLPLRAKQRFLQAGEAALQTPIAPLPLSLWLDFTRTGRSRRGSTVRPNAMLSNTVMWRNNA